MEMKLTPEPLDEALIWEYEIILPIAESYGGSAFIEPSENRVLVEKVPIAKQAECYDAIEDALMEAGYY
jgi:hypothetical protein